jgi:ATP-dependent DNA helicase RecQ
MGLLEVDAEGFGALRLTAAARPVLKGEQSVQLRREAERKRDRGSRAGSSAAALLLSQADAAVFEALRTLRAALAREQNLPAYVIFHDATLREMAVQRPASLAELGGINGVGASKLERYGPRLLQVLQEARAA